MSAAGGGQSGPFDKFTDAVCGEIMFRPAHRGVRAELTAHLEDRAEALEFRIQGEGPVTGMSLEQLSLKPNILIACISRGGQAIIPKGSDCMLPGDSVIVVTTNHGLKDISDILKTV